ncbi:MAG: hypothetical protein RIC35_21485 [Marinoscillum sp.]
MMTNTIQNKRVIGILMAIGILLAIPFFAMQMTDEVIWSPFDFLVAGVLLASVGFTCELILRKVTSFNRRLLWLGVALVIFFLVWAELAVGIFGTPFAGS